MFPTDGAGAGCQRVRTGLPATATFVAGAANRRMRGYTSFCSLRMIHKSEDGPVTEPRDRDPLDRMVEAYETMLERVGDGMDTAAHRTVPALRHALERARETAVELGELTREEAERIASYLERDVRDAAHYLADTGEVTGQGSLTCVGCGHELHFARPGHIPPCPGCQGTEFKRPVAEVDDFAEGDDDGGVDGD